MKPWRTINPNLTTPDLLVLKALLHDESPKKESHGEAIVTGERALERTENEDGAIVEHLRQLNDPHHPKFDPTIFLSYDVHQSRVFPLVDRLVLQPYIRLAQKVVRNSTDVVIFTHLLLYLLTSIPSALYLFLHFRILHGIFHTTMQLYYMGTYTLMMHQHIHMRGVLSSKWAWVDVLFPYITDPLMGHTWNSYYYHHIKHHHVESNGPTDISSTLKYQRDDIVDFLKYLFRFLFFIWIDLPRYFIAKQNPLIAFKAAVSEMCSYLVMILLAKHCSLPATIFVFIIPLVCLRIGLTFGNWGQHSLIDDSDPDSDFRSSVTLIDTQSNRFCFNDGYHTSHHLNPRRHWREHPLALLTQKQRYADEQAIILYDIDFFMLTISLLRKRYMYLAARLIPIGKQVDMSLEDIAAMLQSKTRKFTKDEIVRNFR